MKIEIHTVYDDVIHPTLLTYHKKVFNYFGLTPIYTKKKIHPYNPGYLYNEILKTTDADLIIFSDSDAVPINDLFYDEIVKYCSNNYIIGVTQVTPNHNTIHEFYCAPAFMGISKTYYDDLGNPSFEDEAKIGCEVGQQITKKAIELRKRIKLWFPNTFQAVPRGGLWRYSSYGFNGIGSIYDEKIYHLFEGRFSKNIELFAEACEFILQGKSEKIPRPYDCKNEYENILPITNNY